MTRREQRWRNIQLLEWLWIALMIVGFMALLGGRFPAPLFWGYLLLFLVGGLLFPRQQYLTLDEFGQLRWLKSQTVFGLILGLGISALVFWGLWRQPAQLQFEPLLMVVTALLTLSLLAAWGTWTYLGWRDSRELAGE